ncbi:MAG: ketoacyl-ACP synthase III [Pseudomonadota bacterium]
MIGISAIYAEIPEQRIPTEPRIDALGIPLKTLQDRVGVIKTSRKALDQDTADLCVAAANKLFAAGRVSPSDIDCVIVVTQNPDGQGLPQTSAIVQDRLGIPENCASFDVSLGCSGYVYGLSIIKSFMQDNGLRCGLLFTADPYSKIVSESDRSTALLFGDAATVTLMTESPVWKIGKFDFGTAGRLGQSIRKSDDGTLIMDGRAVLGFSMSQVPGSLQRVAAANGITLEQIDRFVLHQGSRVVVENIAERLKVEDKTAFYAQDYGNTVSSSIPIVLSENLLESDRCIAISGFGVGLSWASAVLEKVA